MFQSKCTVAYARPQVILYLGDFPSFLMHVPKQTKCNENDRLRAVKVVLLVLFYNHYGTLSLDFFRFRPVHCPHCWTKAIRSSVPSVFKNKLTPKWFVFSSISLSYITSQFYVSFCNLLGISNGTYNFASGVIVTCLDQILICL